MLMVTTDCGKNQDDGLIVGLKPSQEKNRIATRDANQAEQRQDQEHQHDGAEQPRGLEEPARDCQGQRAVSGVSEGAGSDNADSVTPAPANVAYRH